MSRNLIVASGQMGPIQKTESRTSTTKRLLELMKEAKARGADFLVYPELALTTFFPRWQITDQKELESYYETMMPNNVTLPLFEEAKKLEIGFYMGYAELAIESGKKRYFNTSILVNSSGQIIGKYRKIHLPGHSEPKPNRKFQHLEKAYFEPGDLGFPVYRAFNGIIGMAICNDRRWPEMYRVMGLQGVELIALGYNTPFEHVQDLRVDSLTLFHNHLSMQAGAYHNSSWVIGTAKCGNEEGSKMGGQSVIIAPSGEIVAQSCTVEDEVITSKCDLDFGKIYKETVFNFAKHRRPEHYQLITTQAGAIPPK